MTNFTFHYAGDQFRMDAEEAAEIEAALRLAATGSGMVATLEYLKADGSVTTQKFLITLGVQAYLTESPATVG